MLGLTDKEISHHPDYIPGIPSSWKERKYNAAYVLSQDPDFIIFSTGYKPSAPAERALFLYSEFRQNYYSFHFRRGNQFLSVFRTKGPYEKENQIFHDTRFVNLYNEVLSLFGEKQWAMMREKLNEVLEVCPEDFAWAYQEMGRACFLLGNYPEGKKYLSLAIEMDPYCVSARGLLGSTYAQEGRYEKALEEYEVINLYNPGLVEAQISNLRVLINKEGGKLE